MPVLLCGNFAAEYLVVLSPGFASSLTDYAPVVKALESRALIARVFHQGNGRMAGLEALLRLIGWRVLRSLPPVEAARKVREHIHRPVNRERRVEQLSAVLDGLQLEFPARRLSLLGHSYGTDTVLRAALRYEVESLVLLSPHPPGYIFPERDYPKLRARRVSVVTGTEDWTRDGVGPRERLKVAGCLAGDVEVAATCLTGVGHMAFAFSEIGPSGWDSELSNVLNEVMFSERGPAT